MGNGANAMEGEATKSEPPDSPSLGESQAADEVEKITKSGVLERLRGLLGPSSENTDALTQALQKGDGVAAGLSKSRRDMIERVIAFDAKRVEDVLIPRADIVAVEMDTSLTVLLKTFSKAGHSRLPVYRGDLDDPVGMIHIRDIVGMLADPDQGEESASVPILSILTRKVLYVPPSMKVTDLLLRMQANHIHMALVIDEYGGTDGLVTIEDLIEEIVGEIQDEHDEDDIPTLRPISENCWEATARLPMEDLEQALNLVLHEGDDEIDTLGGLVFALAGRVPLRGEVLTHAAGIEFEVLDADARRIRSVRVRRLSKNSPLVQKTQG